MTKGHFQCPGAIKARTIRDRDEVRRLRATGLSYREIADRMGLGPLAVAEFAGDSPQKFGVEAQS